MSYHSKFEEEDIELEYSEDNKKSLYIKIGAGVIALCVIIATFYVYSFVEVSDYVGLHIDEAENLSKQDAVIIIKKYDTSIKVDKNYVISQSIKAEEKVKRGNVVELTISTGPDMEEEIKVPNFLEMNKVQIEDWCTEKVFKNCNFKNEYSEIVKKGDLIKYEIEAGETSTITRKDIIKFIISTGNEDERQVTVPKFKNKSETELITFCIDNDIQCVKSEEFSDIFDLGNVMSANVKEDEKISVSTVIEYVVSKGEGYIVDDFSRFSQKTLPSVEYSTQIVERYNGSAYGTFLGQSIPRGTKIDSTEIVILTFSKGNVSIGDYTGGALVTFQEYVDQVNVDGASLNYTIKRVDDTEKVGSNIIVKQNIKNIKVGIGTTIELTVTK